MALRPLESSRGGDRAGPFRSRTGQNYNRLHWRCNAENSSAGAIDHGIVGPLILYNMMWYKREEWRIAVKMATLYVL